MQENSSAPPEPLLTQLQNEERMFYGGIKRAEGMMAKAEEQGRAYQNPYAKELFREYVLPLAEVLRAEQGSKAAIRQAHAILLKALDPEAVAYLTVRSVIGGLLHGTSHTHHRALAYSIGTTVHCELVLEQIEAHNPALYHTLARDFQRRMSKDERHRMTVFKRQANEAGILIAEWPRGSRDQVGLYLLGLLEDAGMIDIAPPKLVHGKMEYRNVSLKPEIMERINEVKEYVAMTMPVYGPCVEPPKDWITPTDGGFHSRELRRTNPALVRASASNRALYRDAQMPTVLSAVNALQRTAWQVNTQMLDAVLKVATAFSTKEIVTLVDTPKPTPPAWLATCENPKTLPDHLDKEFKGWKRKMTDWYEARKLLGTRYGRFYSATRSAEMFRDYPAIYFVHFADSRGRLYPMTYGLNPQGSDLQKSLIRFSTGKPLTTPAAIRWFHVHGANKWGFDKATLEERHKWVVDRQDLILSFAADPVNNSEWKQADCPLQFLAWCFEYQSWVNDTTNTFVSHLPISMDGSCNGLQNLSALLRDEIGGAATNLVPSVTMRDIYKTVAEAAMVRMKAGPLEDPAKEALRVKWIEHGISRSVVKRSVMTTPYGVTHRTAAQYVVSDYLADGQAPCFEKAEWVAAASVLMSFVWPAIGDVVVKGREAMDWLRKAARAVVKTHKQDEETVIWWETPSGFPASQCYYEADVYRIKTRLHGPAQIRILSETDEPDLSKHASGLAPNFVHSMDAAHLHLTTAAAYSRGIDALAMIHDDYGTHAADAQQLFELIRERFVWMYENHDPIAAFKEKYPMSPTPPSRGSLDIQGVLESTYFFS